jgi:protein SCO1
MRHSMHRVRRYMSRHLLQNLVKFKTGQNGSNYAHAAIFYPNFAAKITRAMRYLLFFATLIVFFSACFDTTNNKPLPILGERDIAPGGDTLYPTIPDFSFIDQDSQIVTNATFAGKAYVVDFFFIHCPTICPKVKANGLRLYQRFKDTDGLMLLSHSIDVRNDTVAALRHHAEKLGIDAKKWRLVTGEHDAIYGIADNYFSVAKEDPSAPGGFDHSGRLILVDKNRHVRAFCDGTDAASVDRFMADIDKLLQEK